MEESLMLHTLKERGDGVVPNEPWMPSVRRPMLRGPSADALYKLVAVAWLAVILSVILMVAVVSGSHGSISHAWDPILLLVFTVPAVTAAGTALASTLKTRREYRHGYTTLQSFSRYGLYYRTVAQLDPRTGVEVRAAGEPKIDMTVLKERCQAARAQQLRPARMSRHEAAETARMAHAVDEANHATARAKSARARLVQRFGTEAGNLAAAVNKYVLFAIIVSCSSFPLMMFGIEGAYLSRNPSWLIPFATAAAAVTALLVAAKKKRAKSRKLAAQFLGVPVNELPRGTFSNPLGLAPDTLGVGNGH